METLWTEHFSNKEEELQRFILSKSNGYTKEESEGKAIEEKISVLYYLVADYEKLSVVNAWDFAKATEAVVLIWEDFSSAFQIWMQCLPKSVYVVTMF